MSNQNGEVDDIIPYLDSFKYFSTDNSLKNQFGQIFNQLLSKHKEDITNNDILKKHPRKAFDYLLDELHKKWKNINRDQEEEQNNRIKAAEINKENALNSFLDFTKSDESFISKNFFGIKLISKKCNSCHMTQYVFKYLKSIKINITEMARDTELDLERCFKRMVNTKTNKNDFCPICSTNQDLEISFEIIKCPKIMIIILQGQKEIRFKVEKNILHNKYKLVAAEKKQPKGFFDFVDDLIKKEKSKNYEFVQGNLNEQIFKKELPLVLFYQKQKESQINGNYNNMIESFFLDDVKGKDNKSDSNSSDEIIDKMPKESLIQSSKKSNRTGNQKGEEIILYFDVENGDDYPKAMYIKTTNNDTFKNMIPYFEKNYDYDLDYLKCRFSFNGKKIDINKTPRDYDIPNESHICIKP